MKTAKPAHVAMNLTIKSKSIQSLGWFDRLFGDRKDRERAARKMAEIEAQIHRSASK